MEFFSTNKNLNRICKYEGKDRKIDSEKQLLSNGSSEIIVSVELLLHKF